MAKNTTTSKRVLTEAAQITVKEWQQKYGSLRMAISTGIMALKHLSPEQREECLAEANALPTSKSESSEKKTLHNAMKMIKEMTEVETAQPGTIYRVLTLDEQQILDDFRRAIEPQIPKKKVKKAKRG